MRLRIKTCFHWKNIAKTFGVVVLAGLILTLFFIHLNISPILALIVGVFIGCGTAIYCSNRWKLWHFENELH